MTVHADDPYAALKNDTTVVHFDNKEWYLIDYDTSSVTLLSKECVCASKFNDNGSNGNLMEGMWSYGPTNMFGVRPALKLKLEQ